MEIDRVDTGGVAAFALSFSAKGKPTFVFAGVAGAIDGGMTGIAGISVNAEGIDIPVIAVG